jgi:hypothetical protein
MFTKLLCLLGSSLALLPSASHAAAPAPSATLEAGVIVGKTSTAPGSTVTVNQFLGVPFAAKPVRFSMPEPPPGYVPSLSARSFFPQLPCWSYKRPNKYFCLRSSWFHSFPISKRVTGQALLLSSIRPFLKASSTCRPPFVRFKNCFFFSSFSISKPPEHVLSIVNF